LPDINVWLAFAVDTHQHHTRAQAWFRTLPDGSAAMCRVSQMGLLRLLTNRKVLGPDVLNAAAAWEVNDLLLADPRVWFVNEPGDLVRHWRAATLPGTARSSGAGWTDAYLWAFAEAAQLQGITFDRGLARTPGPFELVPA
jgi:hypothetical protein